MARSYGNTVTGHFADERRHRPSTVEGGLDILGVDSAPDGVADRVDGVLGAREILAGIEDLLTSTS